MSVYQQFVEEANKEATWEEGSGGNAVVPAMRKHNQKEYHDILDMLEWLSLSKEKKAKARNTIWRFGQKCFNFGYWLAQRDHQDGQ